MIPMNMFKSNGGFTLVELIVVIAIIAILAGVAVPAYSGYIAKANEVEGKLDDAAVERAVIAALSFHGVAYTSAIDYTVTNGTIAITGAPADLSADINTLANELYE